MLTEARDLIRRGRGGAPEATAAFHPHDGALIISLSGDWRLDASTPKPRFEPSGAVRAVGFDATALGAWDSSLLVFLRQGQSYCEANRCTFDPAGLPDRVTELLALAAAVPERVVGTDEPAHPWIARLGVAGLGAWDSAVSAAGFLGEVTQGLGRLLTGRARMQWRAFWVVVQSNSSGALPIVTLIALLVGAIIAFLGAVVLQRFGAGYYTSFLVGYGMLREMGALMTGIIIAGRTGAGFAAELGSMKITEELDAYATLGISPVDHLVLPRVLGLFVMMPLLVIYADVVGILGGLMVSVALIDLTPTQYFGGMLTAVALSDALLGVFKGTVFGLIIGLSGCMHGLRTGSDASAVGRSATSAVVLGITLIIVANAAVDWLAALWKI